MSNEHDVFIWGIETMRIVKLIEVKAKIYIQKQHPEESELSVWKITCNLVSGFSWPKVPGCFLRIIDCKSLVSRSDMIATSLFS